MNLLCPLTCSSWEPSFCSHLYESGCSRHLIQWITQYLSFVNCSFPSAWGPHSTPISEMCIGISFLFKVKFCST